MKTNTKKSDTNHTFSELTKLMAKLRSDNGCPWDKEQTFDSLKIHIIEEAYEVVDAINKKSLSHLKEELGDLMFIIIFLSQIAAEQNSFSVKDVISDSINKMVRRHPHVFGKKRAKNSKEAHDIWQEMKRKEKLAKNISLS